MGRRLRAASPPPPPPEPEEELDEEEEPETEPERVTFVAVPSIFEDAETPEKEPLLEPIVQISVYRRQDPAGTFSWLANVQPSDVPDESAILSAWGVGVFKLIGKDAANRHRRIRLVSVGDWGPKPIGVPTAAPTVHHQPAPRESGSLLNPTIITAVLGFFTTLMQQMRESSREEAAARANATKEMLQVVTSFQAARTGDLEQLLRQALAAKGGGNSAEHVQDMLAMQQAIFEDLLEKARSGGGGDGVERLIESAMAGWAKGNAEKNGPPPPSEEANGASS